MDEKLHIDYGSIEEIPDVKLSTTIMDSIKEERLTTSVSDSLYYARKIFFYRINDCKQPPVYSCDFRDIETSIKKSSKVYVLPIINATTLDELLNTIAQMKIPKTSIFLTMIIPPCYGKPDGKLHPSNIAVRVGAEKAFMNLSYSSNNNFPYMAAMMAMNMEDSKDYNTCLKIIECYIDKAHFQPIDQNEMIPFLKGCFNLALNSLEKLVQLKIDLNDRITVNTLTRLSETIHLIPTRRVYTMDAPEVVKDFTEYSERYRQILSVPIRKLKKGHSVRDVTSLISEMRKHPKKVTDIQLQDCLSRCSTLLVNEIDIVNADIAYKTFDLAATFMSEAMFKEARCVWAYVIKALESENPWIEQRIPRLQVAKDAMSVAVNPWGKQETTDDQAKNNNNE